MITLLLLVPLMTLTTVLKPIRLQQEDKVTHIDYLYQVLSINNPNRLPDNHISLC